jgi:hypothetical protein
MPVDFLVAFTLTQGHVSVMLQDKTISASKCQDEISKAIGHAAPRGDHRVRRGEAL